MEGEVFSSGDFSWEVGGNFPKNSYNPFQDPGEATF